MQQLVTIHSWTRWLVLAALVGGLVIGLLRYRSRSEWSPHYYQLMVMVIDIQVTIGIAIWLFYDGWNRGFFYAVLHPVAMILALAIAHVGFVVAKRRSDIRSWLLMTVTAVASLTLVVAAIPWNRL